MATQIENDAAARILKHHRDSSALDLAMQLMKIRGPSGGEAAVAEFICQRLLQAGATTAQIQTDTAHRKTPIKGDTGNLILKLPGNLKGPRRMFSAHMDTVPICVGSVPKKVGQFIRSADKDHGIGADDRAGVATILNAATLILEHNLPHPPLTFCWFIQEEIGLHGARCVAIGKLGKPQLAFNWDGGSPAKLTLGATGGYRMGIVVKGIASHAGNAPEQGVSAIAIAALAIAQLQKKGWHGLIRKKGRSGTSNIGVIQGGHATNVVTDDVQIRAEARSHDPEFREEIVQQIKLAFEQAVCQVRSASGGTGSVEFDGRLDYESFRLNEDEPSVQAADAALRTIGEEPMLAIANGGVDANWLNVHGIPAVTMGCGQVKPHMVTEALNIKEFQTACRIALILATAQETNPAEGASATKRGRVSERGKVGS